MWRSGGGNGTGGPGGKKQGGVGKEPPPPFPVVAAAAATAATPAASAKRLRRAAESGFDGWSGAETEHVKAAYWHSKETKDPLTVSANKLRVVSVTTVQQATTRRMPSTS